MTRMQKVEFKKDFVWGVATAAYQIEGAADTDGRGESVWDAFCRTKGAIKNGDTGLIACDHYHRFREDIAIMRDMGVQAYRFSLSWPRILPKGTGRVNAKGLDFYDRLVDALLEFGITPFATLFHWDYPQQLYLRGGWLNRESVDWFGEYTAVVAERLSDRVQDWWTLNEPPCFLGLGHMDGIHAPGLKLPWAQFLLATKHALMAHGTAVKVLREEAQTPARIGYVPISHIGIPQDESPENVQAAREFTFGVPDASRSFWFARLYLDPVVLGQWPAECIAPFTNEGPNVSQEELALMSQPIDRLGLNFYSGPTIRQGSNGKPEVVPSKPGTPRTAFDWEVTPEGLYWSVKFHQERYGLPMMIAENGMSSLDWVNEAGEVDDPQRIDFLRRYLRSLNRAEREGLPIEGFFQWSLLDNFEWAEGYKHRFGLVHVDFETQVRTVKASGRWYRDTIARRGFDALPERRAAAVELISP